MLIDDVKSQSVLCPAKINLFLAVTGLRSDGYHNLLSWVAPLNWGDRLSIHQNKSENTSTLKISGKINLEPCPNNLILKAVEVFTESIPDTPPYHFELEKNIPIGAGLGGGSSNAATALKLINQQRKKPVSKNKLLELAARVGSDCPLFLQSGPCLLRGRGDQVEALDRKVLNPFSGKKVLLIRPEFEIETPWAYQQLKKYADYQDPKEAENCLKGFINKPLPQKFFNQFQVSLCKKYIGLTVFLQNFKKQFPNPLMITGSGSVLFTLIDESEISSVIEFTEEHWGEESILAICDFL